MSTLDCDSALDAPRVLRLPDRLWEEIIRHLRRTAPREGVGLLAARLDGRDGSTVATRYYPGTNQDDSATRYTMPPDEVLAALQDMEGRGWRLGGIVHSHPAGPATPSSTDRTEYRYPEALMIIVSLAGDSPEVRAWWFGRRDTPWPAEVPVVGEERPDRRRGGRTETHG